MKGIDDLDHYELLEIPRSAGSAEIERAYHLAQQTYARDSLALYSVFEASDASAIRDRIEEAYRVLADPETREAYDRSLGVDEPEVEPAHGAEAASSPAGEAVFGAVASDEGAYDEFAGSVDDYDVLDEESGDFGGVRLRRARLFRGYEIEDISEVTKVSGAHLRNIEEEKYQDLPADVYVRGFVTAYARTIGLDPDVVVPSYMARMQEKTRQAGTRGRFLGRR